MNAGMNAYHRGQHEHRIRGGEGLAHNV